MSNKFVPPQVPGYHCVGWVKSAHGIRGEIFVHLQAQTADWLNSLENLGLRPTQNGEFKLWPVEAVRAHKEGLIVKLKGVNDRNHSESLRKQSVYVGDELLEAKPGESVYLKQILGFQVVSVTGDAIGEIIGFATNGVQDLLRVKASAEAPEALVPLVDAFLRHIDFDKRTVTMDLPQGLFDL